LTLLGIVVALKAEARGLVKKPISADEVCRVSEETIVKLSGLGPKMAHLAGRTLVKEGATALLSWGSAGGLSTELFPGSLIIPETVFSSNQTGYLVNTTWHERLCSRLNGHVNFHTGPLIQSTTVLINPDEKRALFKNFGAVAVDMESVAVARVALQAKVPFVAIRAISDPAYMAIPASAMAGVDEFGGLHPLSLLKSLARHPQEIFALVCLCRNFLAAQASLNKVLRLTDHKLLAP